MVGLGVGDADVGPVPVTGLDVVVVESFDPGSVVGPGLAVVTGDDVMPVPLAGSAVVALSLSDLENTVK